MRVASITEAKNTLSALIARVRAGESVLILDRGVPVARLEPVVGTPEGRTERLERVGVIRRGRGRPPTLEQLADGRPSLPPGESLVDAVLEERREGP
jgi:prevent-host-death family protein